MAIKSLSPRRRLAGAHLIGLDTAVWKNLAKRSVRAEGKLGRRSKILAAKAGVKTARGK